jgi:hypothetical protein
MKRGPRKLIGDGFDFFYLLTAVAKEYAKWYSNRGSDIPILMAVCNKPGRERPCDDRMLSNQSAVSDRLHNGTGFLVASGSFRARARMFEGWLEFVAEA